MPSSERARSSIASDPVFRSRTSASSASLRAFSFAFAALLRLELPVELAHLQPAALAEPHRILQRGDQQDEDERERSARAVLRYLSWKNASRPG